MSPDPVDSSHTPDVAETLATVRRWLDSSAQHRTDPAAARLAALLRDPDGLPFTLGFVDGVIRPEDARVAARHLAQLSRRVPRFLPWHLRTAVRLGGRLGPLAPWLVIPIARRTLRRLVGHLVIDARPGPLGAAIRRLRGNGTRLNINLLGEAVLGRSEATRRLDRTIEIVERDDVDHVSIKVSSAAPPHQPWGFDAAVDDIVDALLPLYTAASASGTFVNLDMEEYRDLDLTLAVFERLLDRPEFVGLEAGIVLQAYLPDALSAMMRVQDWAAARRARGGARVAVRVVKGANLPMERVDADLHGWPLATWHDKAHTDASYKNVLDFALHPERTANVRIGVAGHNLFDIAWTWELAGRRGVRDDLVVEMLLGMSPAQAAAVRDEVGSVLLYTPVVSPDEFDVAIAYLVRRLEEGANDDNYLSAAFDLTGDDALFEREQHRFLASLELMSPEPPPPHRTARAPLTDAQAAFTNCPDTDPSVEANRAWARAILARVPHSTLGENLTRATTITQEADLDAVLAEATGSAPAWGSRSAADRASVLRSAARLIDARRHEFLEVMASECGKTLDQSDPEVSEAVDFARWYAERCLELDAIDGATFSPVALTAVVPPWNFPVAIPAGSTLAALAAGSAVIIKPAPQSQRCAAVLVQTLWDAGVPRDVLHLVNVDEGDLGRALVADPRIDRMIFTGSYDTAALFRSFRPDLPILGETSGKNAIIVTPTADLDHAVRDVVASAFGHAGQKCSAASLVILVGSVARSDRFRRQLIDAAASLHVGDPADERSQVGPLIEPPTDKLLHGLTELDAAEEWWLEPRRLDERTWTPGIRAGVRPDSTTHRTEYFGPVLGVMTARSLDEAIALQNAVEYGLTAGLHSLDRDEICTWLARVEAGNLYVNRGTTGAIVRRQPFGGWKKSSVGPGAKAGGPSHLLALGDWSPAPATVRAHVGPAVRSIINTARDTLDLTDAEYAYLQRCASSDAAAWSQLYATPYDASGLVSEHDVLRHLPTDVQLHVGPAERPVEVTRVLLAGVVAGARVSCSGHATGALRTLLDRHCASSDDARPPARMRAVGADPAALARSLGGRLDVAIFGQPVTESGRLELLPFLREQAVSVTAHRFGTPDDLTRDLL